MHMPPGVRFLSLPVAIGLGTALLMACSEEGPTAPGSPAVASAETAFEFAGKKKGKAGNKPIYRDNTGEGGSCDLGGELVAVTGSTSSYDDPANGGNGDGFICRY